MTERTSYDLVVIGAGVAGLTAAREALRAGLKVAYIEGQVFGGLILNINELDGAITGSGAEYASNLVNEIAELGGQSLEAAVLGIEIAPDGVLVRSEAGDSHARAVIVASGATLKKLEVPGEAEFEFRGVSHCADCDGPMFQGQQVVVVGGGDSALQAAKTLSQFCERVVVLHRGKAFDARRDLVDAVAAAPNVEARFECAVDEVIGGETVEGVRIGSETLPCSGLFAYVGLAPATDFLPQAVERDARGAIVTSRDFETGMPNVFAAGAARSGCGGMVEDAVADAMGAARVAIERLRSARRNFAASA